ncbi:Rib/alpha-like domain-containing protein, partial [Bacillus cereus]|uniref:Rib/alpha-like domain-containing protein n=1 Tax=Bacillus cereus TaxID=1396 RepID=UPI0011552D1A
MTAEPVPSEVNLGNAYVNPKELIKNVKLDNKLLGENDYTVVMKKREDTNTSGDRVFIVTVTYKSTGQAIDVRIPIKVTWGNSFKLNGTYWQTILALTAHRNS